MGKSFEESKWRGLRSRKVEWGSNEEKELKGNLEGKKKIIRIKMEVDRR